MDRFEIACNSLTTVSLFESVWQCDTIQPISLSLLDAIVEM